MKNSIIVIALLTATLSGCSVNKMWYGSDLSRISYTTVLTTQDEKTKEKRLIVTNNPEDVNNGEYIAALISWSPEFNAAFINENGKGCIQPAAYAVTDSGELKLPVELLDKNIIDDEILANYTQELIKLTTVSERSTYLSIGMYGLCQMLANNGITNEQLLVLTNTLLMNAANINDQRSTPILKKSKSPSSR
ncbi:hypothetical protein [Shewanella algae]|uniref:hypothetical protein n=1 Tax=Shewanella algae TaxID=38313 RepID=UPI001AADAA6E|nr:hypothetical protein [Shewanella algae]MBO2550972.1 hypothetical protein [Shewanella algae]